MTDHITYSLVDSSAGSPNVSMNYNQYVFNYPCTSNHECTNYELTINRGVYLVELYGASGGFINEHITLHRESDGQCPTLFPYSPVKINTECSSLKSVAGAGGYTSGVISIAYPTKAYLAIGGQGKYAFKIRSQGTPQCYDQANMIEGGYNGGGWASNYFANDQAYGSGSGGGSTDLRFEVDDVFHRVIVAGAGGGIDDDPGSGDDGSGGSGGGLTAQSFRTLGALNTDYVAGQTSGFTFGSGESARENGSNNPKGCAGDTATSSDRAGSGSGWFGGFASHSGNAGAGGGSSFILTANAEIPEGPITAHDTFYGNPVSQEYPFAKTKKYFFEQPVMYQGVWAGNGFASITYIRDFKPCTHKSSTSINCMIFVTIFIAM